MSIPNHKPDILEADSDEMVEWLTFEHAKYFTVIQIRPGGWKTRSSNYIRREAPNFAVALEMAQALHLQTGKICLIYAVTDFIGASNFSRLVTAWPHTPSPYGKARKAAEEKKKAQRERARLREEAKALSSQP
jgi:hypothetical protein